MAPLSLKGETLGEKRRNYNQLVNEAISLNSLKIIPKINYEEQDIDNLFKIDIASHNHDVDYIVEVLKCEDMLYVSRAIKQARWLIQDNKYAHIINPTYLNDNLFPQMTVKAKNKLMLQIRLHLKEERRVEEFCNYLLLQDVQLGLKWLSHCSIKFIEGCIEKYASDIPTQLMKRLCRRSFTFIEICTKYCNKYNKFDILQATIFLLRKNAEKFLDLTNTTSYDTIKLGPKATRIIMKTCPNKILNNLEHYKYKINIRTFSKFIKKEEIKDLLINIRKKENMKHWLITDNIQHFLKRLPKEDFPFVKQTFIEQTSGDMERVDEMQDEFVCFSSCRASAHTSANIYRWYKFAPFITAFKDLKKLIRTESNPNERYAILAVLLCSAGQNLHHIQCLLQYYYENHINEPFVFKNKFVNDLLSKTKQVTIRYDKESWSYLNDIFTSMEVYEESNNNVQSCIKAIILYNIIHDENVPKIIEQKFVFNTLKSYQKSLQKEDKEKVFNYLYKFETDKLNRTEKFDEVFCQLKNILNLLIDWGKDLTAHPHIIAYIKNLSIKKDQTCEDLSTLYNMKKSWRKLLFNDSLLLNPTPEVCLNILKHGPHLINNYRDEISNICNINNMTQRRLLNKVRTFWWKSLADFFESIYLKKLENKINHSSAIFGLSILLPQKQYLELVHQYVPMETKIDWKLQHETKFSLSKNIAKKMHLARPQVPLSTVLLYAKGSSLQFVMPSLNAVLFNMSCFQAQNQLRNVLNAPVSLQKHGIRIALGKLKHIELKQTLTTLWNSTKNSSIRAALMKQTFDLMCKQKNPNVIEEIWDIFSTFIENLTSEDNKTIYSMLSRVDKVPLTIKVRFGVKSYKFLTSLPEKSNRSSFIFDLKSNMKDNIQLFDTDIIVEIFMDPFLKKFTKMSCDDEFFISVYLLSASENEEIQNDRFNKILLPILDQAFNSWDAKNNEMNYATHNLKNLLNCMFLNLEEFVLNKELNVPVVLFNEIFKKLDASLSKRENYILITTMKLVVSYLKVLDKILNIKKYDAFNVGSISNKKFKWKPLYLEAAPEFGKNCLEYLKRDVKEYYPSIYVLFVDVLKMVFGIFRNKTVPVLKVLEAFLEFEDCIEGHLLVLHFLSTIRVYKDVEKSLKSEILNKIRSNPSKEVQIHYWRYQHLTFSSV